MKKEAKSEIIKDLIETLEKSDTFFLIDFKRMKVAETVELRKKLRKNKCSYTVVKNRLALKALGEKVPADVRPFFDGPTAIAASAGDPLGLARIIKESSMQGKVLEMKAGIMEGTFLPKERFDEICKINSRDELLGKISYLMSYHMTQFLRTLKAPLANMGNLMTQLKDMKKE